MAEKMLNTRIQLKGDLPSNWDKAQNSFKPLKNELIIYLPEDENTLYKFKIGDGESYINELDFVNFGSTNNLVWNEF